MGDGGRVTAKASSAPEAPDSRGVPEVLVASQRGPRGVVSNMTQRKHTFQKRSVRVPKEAQHVAFLCGDEGWRACSQS